MGKILCPRRLALQYSAFRTEKLSVSAMYGDSVEHALGYADLDIDSGSCNTKAAYQALNSLRLWLYSTVQL